MLQLHIDIDPGEFSKNSAQVKYDTLSLPYYIMNVNEDIKLIREFEKVSAVCFCKSIAHFDNNQNLLLIDQTMNKQGKDIIICPKRTDVLEYTNWFLSNDWIYNKASDSVVVEMPIITCEHVIIQMLAALNKNVITVYNPFFLNLYFDCVFVLKNNKNTVSDYQTVRTIEEFKHLFNEVFGVARKLSLCKLAEVASYVKAGNFYGVRAHRYENEFKSFMKDVVLPV